MRAKCNCFNCSRHLEFETKDAGATITCPSCGMETRLYVPDFPASDVPRDTPSVAQPTSKRLEIESPPKKPEEPQARAISLPALARIRAGTAYPQLREFIGLGLTLGRFAALLVCLAVLANTMFGVITSPPAPPTWYNALAGSLALAVIFALPLLIAQWVLKKQFGKRKQLARQIALGGSVLSGLIFAAMTLLEPNSDIPSWLARWYYLPIAAVGCIMFCAVVEFLLRVVEQSLLLLVDIADATLHTAVVIEGRETHLSKATPLLDK